jgi:hypothetical protein
MKVVLVVTLAAVVLSLVMCGGVVAEPKWAGDPDIVGTMKERTGISVERVTGVPDAPLFFGFSIEVRRSTARQGETTLERGIVKRLPRIAGPAWVRKSR